jgi:hypothetical protein
VGAAGLPGMSMMPSLPSGVSAAQLAAYFNAGGPQGVTMSTGSPPSMSVTAQLPTVPGFVGGVTGGTLRYLLQTVGQRLGRTVTVGGIVAFIAKWGWNAASQLTGLNMQTLMGLWMKKHGGRRYRRRGITGRQLMNAARVARTLHKMGQQFRAACGPGYGGHRSAAPRHFGRRRKR